MSLNRLTSLASNAARKAGWVHLAAAFVSASLWLCPWALAQPAASPPTTPKAADPNPGQVVAPLPLPLPTGGLGRPKVLSAEQERRVVANELAFMKMEALGDTKISLAVNHAAADDIIAAIRAASPKPIEIENRNVPRIAIGLAVKDTEILRILKAVASLSGTKLFVLPDHFLLTTPEEVRQDEATDRTLWTQSLEDQRIYRENVLETAIYNEMQRAGLNQGQLQALSPGLQNMVQALVNLGEDEGHRPRTVLPRDTEISTKSRTGGGLFIRVELGPSRPSPTTGYLFGHKSLQ